MERSDGDECLLPDTDFMIDEQSSHASGMEVIDRLTFLEQRVQMQDDEIQLLKINMTDVLKRLNISEEHRRAPAKARPASLCLAPKAAISSSSSSLRKSSSSTLPSSPSSRNYSPAPGAKRTPAANTKDTQSTKAKTSSCRKALEIKPKETSAAKTGSRRVSHCRVTLQISLTPLSGRTGSADPEALRSAGSTVKPCKALVQKPSLRDAPKHKSPIKSPSQYFQICY
ncbi:echinoderm microtubule-associated protein-like 1 isoform X2 [Sinocyclocheilus grahami]|uniref:echinoderm microtubule-associated protein-like 1 isoform X2 n=1 Tax=Sinocyclocheilus grahami TaxID=75366 RepID=UPI0007AD47D2|nr:PREDICTED: echinoderm microtubule-associated protein-like 1 isoform X2 [Sinocyclocheilus grahami]